MTAAPITLADVYRARRAIAGLIRRTPLVPSPALSARTGAAVHLKLETLQDTGSFKLRGATNRLAALAPDERKRGVVTVSTGNHGRAVALAARRLGVRATVCMSHLVPADKVEAIRTLGAEARIIGASQDEAAVEAQRLVAEEGMILVPPFDDPHIIAGQGTVGLELLEDLPEIDTVLIPLSGGGLAAGISMERGPAMYHSLRAGRPVQVSEEESLADSLGGGIGLDNTYTYAMVRDLVDEVVLVGEDEIAAAMRHAYWEERQIAEGGGSVGIAVLLAGRIGRPGGHTVCLLSGRNVDMTAFTRIVAGPAATSDDRASKGRRAR